MSHAHKKELSTSLPSSRGDGLNKATRDNLQLHASIFHKTIDVYVHMSLCVFVCYSFVEMCYMHTMNMCLQLWEAGSGKCVATLVGHKEEVLDVCFDLRGHLIATASADGEMEL